MTVQVWDNADTDFIGRLAEYTGITVELLLSEAGSFSASAGYAAWRGLMEVVPNFHHVRLYGADGTQLMHGIWLTRDDDTGVPGVMEMQGNDLLEELRWPCLVPDFYISHYPVLDAISWLLTQSGTEWVIGDTSHAVDTDVSVNLGGKSYLEAVLELAELSGNYLRHDGVTRSLDVLADPFETVAYLRGIAADDEALPAMSGRIVSPISLTIDAGSVLRGVYPAGGSIIDEDGNESVVRPLGNEVLPVGFSFSRLNGQIAILNDSVITGLIRVAEYALIEPLSNRTVTITGNVETGGAGYLRCEALRRPNDGFWAGATIEIAGVEYTISTHSGDTITGGWPAAAVGDEFSVKREFEYDAVAEAGARQDLVYAACGLLRSSAEPAQQLSVNVEGLNATVKPGDTVRLEWVATVETRNAITDELERYLLESFYGDMVVSSVSMLVGAKTIHTLNLVRTLELLPTESGVREIKVLTGTYGSNRTLTAMPMQRLDVNADLMRLRDDKTPLGASDTCDQGEICWDENFVYVCTETNVWKRTPLATW